MSLLFCTFLTSALCLPPNQLVPAGHNVLVFNSHALSPDALDVFTLHSLLSLEARTLDALSTLLVPERGVRELISSPVAAASVMEAADNSGGGAAARANAFKLDMG